MDKKDADEITRIDYKVQGIILLWELGEITEVEAKATIREVLTEYKLNNDKVCTYYEKARLEALLRGLL